MALTPDFWRSKKIFLTGHTGFKGSWMALWLQTLGAEVCGYALAPPTEPNLYQQLEWDTGHTDIRGDVRDLTHLQDVFQSFQPDIVIHMAAQSLVRQSYREPVATYATNVMGTVHLLEAARQSAHPRVILNVTSDKCYANPETGAPLDEFQQLGGKDPYSNSKACAELVTQAYRDSFFAEGVVLASARAGNVIGGGDWAHERLVPDLARALGSRSAISIRNPQAVRPWQHVLDLLYGYLLLIETLWREGPSWAGPWNFGPLPDQVQPVSFIVEHFKRFWSEPVPVVQEPSPNWPEAHWLMLDSQKARRELGWQSQLDLVTALKWTAEWYQACFDQRALHPFCLDQIDQYQQLLNSNVNS